MDSFEVLPTALPTVLPTALGVDPAQIALYGPYCGGISRERWLEQALDLLEALKLQGQRQLRPSGAHPFELSWQPAEAPQESLSCRLVFPASPGLDYNFSLPTHQLVSWLMDLLEAQSSGGEADLPNAFWRWLLLGEGPEPPPA